MAMITEAAVTYDKSSPAAVSLDAFEGATMTPLVFREQIRRYVQPLMRLVALLAGYVANGAGRGREEVGAT